MDYRKKNILNTKRVRMHLQSALANIGFCEDFDLFTDEKKNALKQSKLDIEIMVGLLDLRISRMEADLSYLTKE